MSETILETNIPREKGWLYFCGTNSKGDIIVCKAKMGRVKKEESKQ